MILTSRREPGFGPSRDPSARGASASAAEGAYRNGDFATAFDLLLEEATLREIPSGELCLKIARCAAALGTVDEAFAWLARIPNAPDSFVVWSSASSVLGRLADQTRPHSVRASSRVGLVGSYTTSQLAAMLPIAALNRGIDLEVHEGLYDQYQQDLIGPDSALRRFGPDHVVLAVHEGALRLPAFSDSPETEVRAEVSRWRGLWEAARENYGAATVQHLFARRPEAAFGHLSEAVSESRWAMVGAINRELASGAEADVSVVDCDRLAGECGRKRWFDDRYWFRAKQAVALEALPLLARHTAAVLAARLGLARKCLVLDGDGTLWGGVVGEDGLSGIELGGEGRGEAFVAFQEFVLELKGRGVILAVASKNNEADVREVFERHPHMRLRPEDVTAFAVNWEDKPANLRRLAQDLGIGLDALVLADDNPAEREIVRRLVPEVEVLALPEEPADYRGALASYLGLEPAAITSEDRSRTEQYRARAAAAQLRSSVTDIESFYRDLRMRAVVAPFDEPHLLRIAQLVVKTNQFNLTTRRHSPDQLRAFMGDPAYITRYLKLADRFADHGLVALVIAHRHDDVADIDTLLMSCRVIGRTVEAHLLMNLSQAAQEAGCRRLIGTYIPTAKNEVVADMYGRLGFEPLDRDDGGASRWEYDLQRKGPIETHFIDEIPGP